MGSGWPGEVLSSLAGDLLHSRFDRDLVRLREVGLPWPVVWLSKSGGSLLLSGVLSIKTD